MPTNTTISKSKQLFVEGKDAKEFFGPFIESIGIDSIQIQDYGGIHELAGFLKQFVLRAEYKSLPVTVIGIVRDAEQNAASAFRSVCSALEKVNLTCPSTPLVFTDQSPKVGVYLFPDGKSGGMIETLLLQAVNDQPALKCTDQYLECVVQATGITPTPRDKARFLAFLASKPDIKPLTGYAARAGYLNFDSPAYDLLKEFIRSL